MAAVPHANLAWNVQAYPSPLCFILLEIFELITWPMEDADIEKRGTRLLDWSASALPYAALELYHHVVLHKWTKRI